MQTVLLRTTAQSFLAFGDLRGVKYFCSDCVSMFCPNLFVKLVAVDKSTCASARHALKQKGRQTLVADSKIAKRSEKEVDLDRQEVGVVSQSHLIQSNTCEQHQAKLVPIQTHSK